jgi:hypothetical protein
MPKEYRRFDEPEVDGVVYRPLHPQECFDLSRLKEVVKVCDWDEYGQTVRCEDRIDLEIEPDTTVCCFPSIPSRGSPEADELLHFAAARNRFIEITPEMSACRTLNLKIPTLDHFYSFFYFSQLKDAVECKRLVRDRVRFKIDIVEIARQIAAFLGDYDALHVRRNDFFELYPEQDISVNRLVANVTKRIPVGSKIYIASDESDRGFFEAVRSDYEVYFVEDFKGMVSDDMSAATIACVEQMICAFARVFIGTKLSTFSGYITRLRGYCGAPNTNVYFTDGSPGSEMDGHGEQLFSWQNWRQIGSPLWGREFKEGWEF